jgi:hypothetical protein
MKVVSAAVRGRFHIHDLTYQTFSKDKVFERREKSIPFKVESFIDNVSI